MLLSLQDAKRYRIGGAKEDRTPDLLRARQALSQLSYGPSVTAEFLSPFTVFYVDCCLLPGCCFFVFVTIFQQPTVTIGVNVVGLGGLEPPTSPLSGVRSNQLSYRP